MFFSVKKGKCFPYDKKRKTHFCHKALIFSLTGIHFSWPIFLCLPKSEKNDFQENEFLKTSKALRMVIFWRSIHEISSKYTHCLGLSINIKN
jgi:hypothetical protein